MTRITATSFGVDGVEEVAVSIDGGEQVIILKYILPKRPNPKKVKGTYLRVYLLQ
jgi:hypothetical protein